MKNKILWLLFILALLISSCVTQQKKEGWSYQFFRQNPAKLAELCANQYPPKDSIAPGKVTHTSDTTYLPGKEIPCPEPTTDPQSGKQKPGSVKCPPTTVIDNTTECTPDTIYRENTARVQELTLKLAAEHDLLKEAQFQAKQNQENAGKWRTRAYIFGILLGLLTIFNLRKFLPF